MKDPLFPGLTATIINIVGSLIWNRSRKILPELCPRLRLLPTEFKLISRCRGFIEVMRGKDIDSGGQR
jgi:hypothetical protein